MVLQIVVTAKRLGETLEPIEIVDQEGNRTGYYTQPFSNAEIVEAKRRSESETGGRTTKEEFASSAESVGNFRLE